MVRINQHLTSDALNSSAIKSAYYQLLQRRAQRGTESYRNPQGYATLLLKYGDPGDKSTYVETVSGMCLRSNIVAC